MIFGDVNVYLVKNISPNRIPLGLCKNLTIRFIFMAEDILCPKSPLRKDCTCGNKTIIYDFFCLQS